MGPDRLSWLGRDEAQRDRVVDMERRLRPVRAGTLGVLCLALLAAAPTEGWWTLAPLLLAGLGFLAADVAMRRSSRPEWAIASAWALSQIAIAVSIALSGEPDSPAVAWLAIPAVTLSARFDGRGVVAGLAFTVGLLLAVTLGVDAAAVVSHPAELLSPLALVFAVTLLSTALMTSDLEHRSESVLDGLTGMLNRRSLTARVSCGVASATGAGFDFARLSAAADAALYEAKRAGRNRVAAAGAGSRPLVAA